MRPTVHLALLVSLLSLVSLGSGCCGPMWHPVGCNGCATGCGPIAFGHESCGCGACEGCGELYIDPWINDPANCCDPCDACGNYNGQSCGKCRSVFAGAKSLWGYRCDDGCGAPSGCDSCGYEAACGCEATCGCESGCDGGCSTCGGGYATNVPSGQSVVRRSTTPTIVSGKPKVHALPASGKQIYRQRNPNQPKPALPF